LRMKFSFRSDPVGRNLPSAGAPSPVFEGGSFLSSSPTKLSKLASSSPRAVIPVLSVVRPAFNAVIPSGLGAATEGSDPVGRNLLSAGAPPSVFEGGSFFSSMPTKFAPRTQASFAASNAVSCASLAAPNTALYAPFPPTCHPESHASSKPCHPESREAVRRISTASAWRRLRPSARFLASIAVAVLLAAAIAPRAFAQNPETMMPEASASKAKQILAQMIDAMGGYAFMNFTESQCSGRVSQFGHNNDLTSYLEFKEYWRYPSLNRTE